MTTENVDNYPVRITTAGYSGGNACSRCGFPVTNGHRVVGTRGPEISRWLILCRECYKVFAQNLPPMFRQQTG